MSEAVSPPAPPQALDQERANSAFLAASVRWIELLLRRQADVLSSPPPPDPDHDEQPPPRRRCRLCRDRDEPAAEKPPTPRTPGEVWDDEVAAAAQAVRLAEAATPRPALVRMGENLRLSPFERDVLVLCVAVALRPSLGRLCADAQGDAQSAFPTFALACAVLPGVAWEAVSPDRGLRRWQLIEIHQSAGQALVTSSLRADERIVNHAKGLDHLDGRLAPMVEELPPPVVDDLPPSQQVVADRTRAAWLLSGDRPVVVTLAGTVSSSKRLVARHVAASFGWPTYRMAADLLPTAAVDLENLARLWQREASLRPLVLYLDADESDPDGPGSASVGLFLARLDAPVVLAAREGWPALAAPSVLYDTAVPTTSERADAWHRAYGGSADPELVDRLAGQFALDVPVIMEIATRYGPGEAWDACLARGRPRLDGLAHRIAPRAGWSDLVLPDDETRTLRQIVDQVRQRSRVYDEWGFREQSARGLGLSVLFTGPSGTGKTLAAEVLAHELQLDLYRTDLSGVMSKYIGETEKNLRRLFDAAEEGSCVLFIDEADALLGKRTEVRDSHDAYANVRTDYLLQRMETFQGLAILATNMRSALDSAFTRRLRFILAFEAPDHALRTRIWERVFPPRTPGTDSLDHARLAQLPLTGGMIRNIALNAAFAAAAASSGVTMPLVLAAARDELRKSHQPIRERDFAWKESAPR